MDKNTEFIGIDISKSSFDVWSPVSGHKTYSNSLSDFRVFLKTLRNSSCCVMEYTGSYHQKLSMFLYTHEVQVSVINPVIIKRFIQMKLEQNKTDKNDARMIALYAIEQGVEPWLPLPEYIEECKLIQRTLSTYFKQRTALKNKLHSMKHKGVTGCVVKSINRQILNLKKEITRMELYLESIIVDHVPDLLTNISSISGIGKKTAMLLIASTYGFTRFKKHNQLSSFFGLAPTERSSGSSLRGISRISKKGNPMVRNHLFLCSFTACEHNPQCKELYERLLAKGKTKKTALVAVCNKLLKQAFAIAKSGIPYDKEYKSKLAVIQ